MRAHKLTPQTRKAHANPGAHTRLIEVDRALKSSLQVPGRVGPGEGHVRAAADGQGADIVVVETA